MSHPRILLLVAILPSFVASADELIDLPPQFIFPYAGYRVHASPDVSETPRRAVAASEAEEVAAAAALQTPQGRFFLTEEGLSDHLAGRETDWFWIPGVSDLPTFVLPAYLDGRALIPVEQASERWEERDYEAVLPRSVADFEVMKQGDDWTDLTLRDAYNELYTIGWSFANLGDLAQAETALEWYALLASYRWGDMDRRGGLVPKGELANFYRLVGNYPKERALRETAFQLHYAEYEWSEDPVSGDRVMEIDFSGRSKEGRRRAVELLKGDVVDFAGNEQIEGYRMYLELMRLSFRHGPREEIAGLAAELTSVIGEIDSEMQHCAYLREEGRVVLAEAMISLGETRSAIRDLEAVIAAAAADEEYGTAGRDPATAVLLARALLENGDAEKAIKVLEGCLVDVLRHERTDAEQLLLAAYLDAGHLAEAGDLARRIAVSQADRAREVMSFSSEEQRVRFLKGLRPYAGPLALDDAEGAALAAMRYKGLVFEASLEEAAARFRSDDEETVALRGELEEAKARAHLLLRSPETGEEDKVARASEYGEAIREVDRIDGLLARRLSAAGLVREALSTTPSDLASRIGPDRMLFDFVRADRYAGRNRYEPVYLAFRHTSDGVAFRNCGDADELERKVASLLARIVQAKGGDSELSAELQSLQIALFGDWLKEISSDKLVLVSPDAALAFVPFGALMDQEGTTMLERFFVATVGSARDASAGMEIWKPGSALLVGNPAYDMKLRSPATAHVNRAAPLRALPADSEFPPLEGAEREAKSLAGAFAGLGIDARTLIGEEASEAAFRASGRSDVVHIATHGLVLPDSRPSPDEDLVLGQMSAGILAFAGANETLRRWAAGEVPQPENDGILSGDEFARMDLGTVRLLVTSACETGLGASEPGEGVMGLRRGVHQAGVRETISTLWPIADEPTVELMERFYAGLANGGNSAASALATAQRECLENWRGTHGLARAICFAAPFTLSLAPKREGSPQSGAGEISHRFPRPPRLPESPGGGADNPEMASEQVEPEPMPGEKYPETRLRPLDDSDFADWTHGRLRYAINEMFARHGATFKTREIQAVFEGMPWYSARPEISFDEIEIDHFSEIERSNLKKLALRRDQLNR